MMLGSCWVLRLTSSTHSGTINASLIVGVTYPRELQSPVLHSSGCDNQGELKFEFIKYH